MMFVHRSTIGSTESAFSGGTIGTTRAILISTKRFTRSRVLAEAKRGDFDGRRIAAGLLSHVAEFRQHLADVATRGWNPAIAIADGAPCPIREGAADMDRRVRFLHRFGPGDHRIKIDELAVIFRLLLRPDFPHRLDRFAHSLEAGRIDSSLVLHFGLVPASPEAEPESTP